MLVDTDKHLIPPDVQKRDLPHSHDLFEAMLAHHHQSTRHKFDLYDAIDPETLKKYEYVFGFSTGHCGTTSFSQKSVFGKGARQDQIHFEHEMQTTRLNSLDYRHMDAATEYKYVKGRLFRAIADAMRPGERVFYDNGHHTLYFMNGLLKFLTDMKKIHEDAFKYHIIRVRRNRVETALSLTFMGEKPADPDHLRTRWHPAERHEDVIYKMGRSDWQSLTPFQVQFLFYRWVECLVLIICCHVFSERAVDGRRGGGALGKIYKTAVSDAELQ
jgi:hypothetical protein